MGMSGEISFGFDNVAEGDENSDESYMHLREMFLFCLAAIVAPLASAQTTNAPEIGADKLLCQRQVQIGAYSVAMYRADHYGRFPNTLEETVAIEGGGTNFAEMATHCPIQTGGAKYVYVNWSQWFGNKDVPTNYPVVYESEIGKHGKGINVALIDQAVFWYENGKWLTDFTKKHPEYGLKLPRIK